MQDVQMMCGSASVRPDDIVNGSREATLGLLWSAFLQFQASCLESCLETPLKTVWQPLLVVATVVNEDATHRHQSYCCSSILCCITLCSLWW